MQHRSNVNVIIVVLFVLGESICDRCRGPLNIINPLVGNADVAA